MLTNPTGVLRDQTHIVDSMVAAGVAADRGVRPGTRLPRHRAGRRLRGRLPRPAHAAPGLRRVRRERGQARRHVPQGRHRHASCSTSRTSARASTPTSGRCTRRCRPRRRPARHFVVLDRPNPIGGTARGPQLDPAYASGVGRKPDRAAARHDRRRAGAALRRRVPARRRRQGEQPRRGRRARLAARPPRTPACRGSRRARTCRPSTPRSSTPAPACSRARCSPRAAAPPGRSRSSARRASTGAGRRSSTTRACPACGSARPTSRRRSTSSRAQTCGGVALHVTDAHAFDAIRTAVAMIVTAKRAVPGRVRAGGRTTGSTSSAAPTGLRRMVDAGAGHRRGHRRVAARAGRVPRSTRQPYLRYR